MPPRGAWRDLPPGERCGERRGSLTGMMRHRRTGDRPCQDCKAAAAAAQADRRARATAAGGADRGDGWRFG